MNDPAQEQPLFDTDIEARMIGLMIREMARNDAPVEQYERLGVPAPRKIAAGHNDDVIEMPSDKDIRAACVLQTEAGRAAAAGGGRGLPMLPFRGLGEGELPFPANLRLKPDYPYR